MTGTSEASGDREDRFATVYDSAYTDLVRFVSRRVPQGEAEDVVADVFAVAWRRLDDVPSELGEARAWLFGVAYRTLLASNRADGRRRTLAVRLHDDAAAEPDAGDADAIANRLDLIAAWKRLDPVHAEALALAAWDGLTSAQAGHMLDISPVAFRIRLSRARQSLRRLLAITTALAPAHPRPAHQGRIT